MVCDGVNVYGGNVAKTMLKFVYKVHVFLSQKDAIP